VAIALLAVVGVLILIAAVLMVQSFRRDEPLHGLTAVALMIVATVPAIVYASFTS
jgi:ABC-type phosphate transport system permease subunit